MQFRRLEWHTGVASVEFHAKTVISGQPRRSLPSRYPVHLTTSLPQFVFEPGQSGQLTGQETPAQWTGIPTPSGVDVEPSRNKCGHWDSRQLIRHKKKGEEVNVNAFWLVRILECIGDLA